MREFEIFQGKRIVCAILTQPGFTFKRFPRSRGSQSSRFQVVQPGAALVPGSISNGNAAVQASKRRRTCPDAWRTLIHRWWGPGLDRKRMEIDLVAESLDGKRLLVGEVKWTSEARPERLLAELEKKSDRLPLAEGRRVDLALWLREGSGERILTPRDVLERLI